MSITTRARVAQRLGQARSAPPPVDPRITEAAMVPGGWFGGWLGVSPFWQNGRIGEYLQAASPPGYVLSANTWAPTVALLLSPGDWDVTGEVDMNPDSPALECTTRLSLDAVSGNPTTLTGAMLQMQSASIARWGGNAGGSCRLLTGEPLTVYGWAYCDVQVSSFYFGLGARRMR